MQRDKQHDNNNNILARPCCSQHDHDDVLFPCKKCFLFRVTAISALIHIHSLRPQMRFNLQWRKDRESGFG